MLWWVYSRVKQCRNIDAVYAATDSEEIRQICERENIPCIMTSRDHPTSTQRLYEASRSVEADVYVCVNGDEPLIEPSIVEQVIPREGTAFFAANLMTKIHSPVEAVDDTNIKVVTAADGSALFMSRSPIPHPKASIAFDYYKHLGYWPIRRKRCAFLPRRPRDRWRPSKTSTSCGSLSMGKNCR